MEVRPPPLSTPGQRKRWSTHFWEFLFLFLAVFCGFLAENFREGSGERRRARQFAVSILNDLKEDTNALRSAIDYGNNKMKDIDSLIAQIELPRDKWKDTLIYKYQGSAGRIRPFVYNSGTYEQMKSSGTLRYFKHNLTDLLNQYALQANKTRVREDIHLNYSTNYLTPFIVQILDARPIIQIQDGLVPTYPLAFRKTDGETIAIWINYASIVKSTQERTVVEYLTMLKKAKQIIAALKEVYKM